jgi:serine/threonine protein kinase
LKPSNIGVNCDATLRIIDFGYAMNMTQSSFDNHYKSPEVIIGMNDTNRG